MQGYLCLMLHAHLPFVRHPEHEKFLEENWLYEAITETYVPLLQVLEGWRTDDLNARLTISLSPTLCSMLQDPLLQQRYVERLASLIHLTEKELLRTRWEPPLQELARFYNDRYSAVRDFYVGRGGDLIGAFARLQESGRVEVATCAATHALLPMLAQHRTSLRA